MNCIFYYEYQNILKIIFYEYHCIFNNNFIYQKWKCKIDYLLAEYEI